MTNYEVLYIDKFVDPNRSREIIGRIPLLSRLSAKVQLRLVSGRPVVIKQYLDPDSAKTIKSQIEACGGTSWVQEQSPAGQYIDRRANKRRHISSRRVARRSVVFQTDRRDGKGRRQNVLF